MTFHIILSFVLFCSHMTGQPSKDVTILKAKIDSLISTHQGTFAIAFKDLGSNKIFYINEHEYFHAASTMKTPVMIEVFKQAHHKKLRLDDSIVVSNSFKSIIDSSAYSLELTDDSDDGLYKRLGQKESIYNLVFKMITVSSNLATNILIGIVGPDNIMNTMKELNLNDMKVLRGVEDTKAFQAGKNNTTTAFDLSIMFERIAKKQCVSVEACNSMLDILLAQKFNTMIPAKLPQTVKVAHKTGSITNVQHDSGIVYLPDGRSYVLVLLSKDLKSNSDGIEILSRVSEEIFNFMVQ